MPFLQEIFSSSFITHLIRTSEGMYNTISALVLWYGLISGQERYSTNPSSDTLQYIYIPMYTQNQFSRQVAWTELKKGANGIASVIKGIGSINFYIVLQYQNQGVYRQSVNSNSCRIQSCSKQKNWKLPVCNEACVKPCSFSISEEIKA